MGLERVRAGFFSTLTLSGGMHDMSLVMRKPAYFICENKDADQLRSNCATDQRLCCRYINTTIPLLS